jgi:hypothetical protein
MPAPKLTFDRLNFTKKLLDPLSRVADSCSLKLFPDKIESIVATPDTVILYLQYFCKNPEITQETTINLPNIKKFLQVFECIEDSFIDLTLESNHLAYNSPKIKFKYFLLDDGVIEVPPLKVEKIEALQFHSGFKLTGQALGELIKGSSFAADTNKIYFSTTDKEVYAELTDQTMQNTDSITFQLADKFVGNKLDQALPLNMDVIRLIGGLKPSTTKVKINTDVKVLMFEIADADHNLKFITSTLVK